MPIRGRLSSNQSAISRNALSSVRFTWLFAAFSLCTAATALIVTVVYVVLPAERRNQEAEAWVEHTHQVIAAIDNILLSIVDAETGQRGFLLTDDTRFLEPYDRGVANIWRQFSNLQVLTSDNLAQHDRLTVLRNQIQAKLAELVQTITLAREAGSKAAVDAVRGDQGKTMMDAIRGTTADMVAEEGRLLLARRSAREQSRQWSHEISLVLAIFGGIGILISGGATVSAIRATSARRRSMTIAAERLRLLNILDFAPIMVRDLDGTIQFWSEGCRRLYGWTAEQAIGCSANELLQTVVSVSPDVVDTDLIRSHEWSGELRNRTQDGAQVIVLAHRFLEQSIDGRGLSVMETVTDVTDARQLEADLRTSEVRLSLFIEGAPAAIAMFDNAMCYLAVSRRFVSDHDLDRQTPATLIGRCHYDIFPDVSDQWRAIHARVLTGETLSSNGEAFSRPDGGTSWIRWEMDPWRSSDGTIGGALLFLEDMTAHKTAEAALIDSEAQLQLVQQIAGIAYSDRTFSEPTMLISSEFVRLYGLPLGQTHLRVDEWVAMLHPDDRDRVVAERKIMFGDSRAATTEFRICRPDGTERSVTMRAEFFSQTDGRPLRIVTAQQDITEIVAARNVLATRRDELEQSNANLEEFAYTISHDLKAPLRAIANLAQWIVEDLKEVASPETTDNLQLLQERITRMRSLLEGLLEYSRVGPIYKTAQNFAIDDVVNDIIVMQAPTSGFVVAYEGDKLIIRTNRIALQVVLENLISNCLKHHDHDHGRIVINARRVGELLEFRVSDDGRGIPQQFHQRIFEIFQTLPTGNDREASGIGLAIVKRKVESHGGRIWVESDPPARGTTFVFTWRETPSMSSDKSVEVDNDIILAKFSTEHDS